MSGTPNSKMLSKLSWRRKLLAFLSVTAATFFCCSLIWPLSIKYWRSESEVALTLTERQDASQEFKKLLGEVVHRHTSPQAIALSLEQNKLFVRDGNIPSADVAAEIQDRLNVVLVRDDFAPGQIGVRVGLDGHATKEDNYFVNILATTIARDFMTSPLAGILPTQPLPAEDVESLQRRHSEIELQANELLAQISNNLRESANELANSDPGSLPLDLGQETTDDGLDQQSDLPSQSFQLASHTLNSVSSSQTVNGLMDSLQTTIGDLANVAAEACMAAETASRTTPAFSVMGVEKRPPLPVNGIPGPGQIMFLLLASTVFGTIVSVAYKPFAQRGFESVEDVGKTLKLPIIATLESGSRFDEVTGPGLLAETHNTEIPGSNQIVNVCKWILFCGAMLTIGFCLVNADIRNAFFVSPFHGFAEIAWTVKSSLGLTA